MWSKKEYRVYILLERRRTIEAWAQKEKDILSKRMEIFLSSVAQHIYSTNGMVKWKSISKEMNDILT